VTAHYNAHFRYDQETQELIDVCNDIRDWDKTLLSCLAFMTYLLPDTNVLLRLARARNSQPVRHPKDAALRERTLLGCLAPIIPPLRKFQDQGVRIKVILVDHDCELSGPNTLITSEVWQASLEAHNARYNTALHHALCRLRI
jgi:hypothetical protein